MITGHFLEKFINGPAHHTLHHLYFTVNYGQVSLVFPPFCDSDSMPQYFTWADRVGGSYRHPDSTLDPLMDVKSSKDK